VLSAGLTVGRSEFSHHITHIGTIEYRQACWRP